LPNGSSAEVAFDRPTPHRKSPTKNPSSKITKSQESNFNLKVKQQLKIQYSQSTNTENQQQATTHEHTTIQQYTHKISLSNRLLQKLKEKTHLEIKPKS
jgi:hypothetical protein